MKATRTLKTPAKTPVCFAYVAPITEHDIEAVKALSRGDASQHQQQIALRCIMHVISGAYDIDFVPGHADQSSFRSGRSWVGKQIERFLKVPTDKLVGAIPDEK